jgi:membrane protein DedA with SNARE-associated domain
MPLGRFTVFSLIGALPWVIGLALAGHALGNDWTSVRKGFEYVDYVVVALIVAGIVYALVRRAARGGRCRRLRTPTAR